MDNLKPGAIVKWTYDNQTYLIWEINGPKATLRNVNVPTKEAKAELADLIFIK